MNNIIKNLRKELFYPVEDPRMPAFMPTFPTMEMFNIRFLILDTFRSQITDWEVKDIIPR